MLVSIRSGPAIDHVACGFKELSLRGPSAGRGAAPSAPSCRCLLSAPPRTSCPARRAGGGRKGAARKGEDLRTAVAEAVAQVKRVLDEGPKTPAELDGLATMLGVVV